MRSYSIGRSNNLDIIRFAAAALVIVSHSFPLAYGDNNREPLYVLSGHHFTLGGVGVAIFFLVSGFLITQSYERSQSATTFLRARTVRIFPGLIGALLFAMLIVGPLATNLALGDYLRSPETYAYMKSTLLVPLQYHLPGVFASNPYPKVVNGSLWTLQYEFAAYVTVLMLGVAKLLRRDVSLILFGLACVLAVFTQSNFVHLYQYFAAGMVFYFMRDHIPLNMWFAVLCLGVLGVTRMHFEPLVAVAGGYLILYLAYSPSIRFHNFARSGDVSYGIYLYAFPVQQLITHYGGGRIGPLADVVLAFPVTLFLAAISWRWIEKPSLRLKNVGLSAKRTA